MTGQGKELVGPVEAGRIYFGLPRNGASVAYTPPANTLDPRYAACTDHHVACDCREAERAEETQEWRLQRAETQAAFDKFLAGHPTYQYDDRGRPLPGCACTGCRIARAAYIHPRSAS